jgi:hypothetical protein
MHVCRGTSLRPPRIVTRVLAACAVLLLTACVPGVDDLLDNLTGKDVETRVLRERGSLLDARMQLDLDKPVTLSGSNTGVCLVLAQEVQFDDTTRLTREYLQGATLRAELVMASGQRIALSGVTANWRSRGVLGHRHELAACMRPCDALPPAGTRISQVVITSSRPVNTLGIYWHSAPTLKERQQRKAGPRADGSPLEPVTLENGCVPPAR